MPFLRVTNVPRRSLRGAESLDASPTSLIFGFVSIRMTAPEPHESAWSCPARFECLDWAMHHNERGGIWGGVSARGGSGCEHKLFGKLAQSPSRQTFPERLRMFADEVDASLHMDPGTGTA